MARLLAAIRRVVFDPATARALLGAAAGAHLILFAFTVAGRFGYAFPLDPLESVLAEEVRRTHAGVGVYVEPSIDFVAFGYGPTYLYAGAFFMRFLADPLRAARAVSIAATLWSCGIVFSLVRRETRDLLAAWVAIALFLGCYRLGGALYDVARVDAFFLAACLTGVYLARTGDGALRQVLAGASLTVAAFAKLYALFFAAPLVVACLVTRSLRRRLLAATVAVLVPAAWLMLDRSTDGWFTLFSFRLHASQAPVWSHVVTFWTGDLFAPLGLALCFVAAFFALVEDRAQRLFWAVIVVGAVLASYPARLKTGGWTNVLFPLYGALAIVAALGLAAARRRVGRLPHAALAAMAVQVLALAYDPRPLVPGDVHRRAAAEATKRVRALSGRTLFIGNPWLLTLAGKASCAQEIAINEYLASPRGHSAAGQTLRQVLAHPEEQFASIIVPRTFFVDPSSGRKQVIETLARGFTRGTPLMLPEPFYLWPGDFTDHTVELVEYVPFTRTAGDGR